jgi:hypothetical protein
MVSKLLNATSEYQDSRGQWFTGHDPLITKSASGTYLCCHIVVPYAHQLIKATISAADVDKTGTHLATIFQADDGDAAAGASVNGRVNVDSSGLIVIDDIALTSLKSQATSGARMYWLKLQGTDANDLMHRPQLSLLVEPVTRSAL